MPAFCEVGRCLAPDGDRPFQNGTDYASTDYAGERHDTADSFDPDAFGVDSPIDEDMGAISAALLKVPGTVRSPHPQVSWAGSGPKAMEFLERHPPDDPNAPLKCLLDTDGIVLLLGVSLEKCTAIHLAEELAGRRPFIRWVRYSDGMIRRSMEGGCSRAFGRLQPRLEHLARTETIGASVAVAYRIAELVRGVRLLLQENPWITACSPDCLRCTDAVKGGPFESKR